MRDERVASRRAGWDWSSAGRESLVRSARQSTSSTVRVGDGGERSTHSDPLLFLRNQRLGLRHQLMSYQRTRLLEARTVMLHHSLVRPSFFASPSSRWSSFSTSVILLAPQHTRCWAFARTDLSARAA